MIEIYWRYFNICNTIIYLIVVNLIYHICMVQKKRRKEKNKFK